MIKIFANIRRQLLAKNKLSKYVLYAIIEIILLVIGPPLRKYIAVESPNTKCLF